MITLAALWVPIVVSAVIVFVVSSIIHMATPIHKGEYPRLPDEDGVQRALRPFNIPPGDYMLPRAPSMEAAQAPEFVDKLSQGPVMVLTVLPNGPFKMGKSLLNWFLYSLVGSLFGAYLASRTLPVGASYLEVFRVTGTVAFACYAVALWQMRIWYNRALRTTVTATIDGFIYACLTAGTFGWLWPR